VIGVTLRGLLSRWRRAVLTSLAAVVGVAIVSGTLMVSDTAGRAGTADSDIDLVRQIMLIAGGVALLVGAFIVNLTTSVTVVQRTRELGLLRCIGADMRQVRRSVLLESLVIGLVAALAGLVSGYGVAIVLRMLINNGPLPGHLPGGSLVMSPRTVAAALIVGCLATVLSALAPARRAGRVSPVAALRDPSPPTGRVRTWRVVCGASTMAAGLALLPIAVATWRGPLLLPAAVLVLVGVRLLGPVFASRLARVVGRPVAAAFGVPGWLGRQNAVGSPERVAATASALMIGIALLTLVNVVSASAEAPLLADYHRDHADLRLTMTGGDQTQNRAQPMDPAAVARLRSLPQLGTVVTVDCVDDPATDGQICAADPAGLSKVLDLEVLSGSLTDLSAGGVGLDEAAATGAHVRVGSTLRLGAASFTVRAVYRGTGGFRSYLLAPAELARVGGHPAPTMALVRLAAGVPSGVARAAVSTAVAGYPNIELQDRDEFHDKDLAAIQGPASVLRILTGLAGVIGLFGIATTLALSTVERRRELGLLRAVGMRRWQIRTMVRAEAVIVALVGTVPGLGVGVLFGWATARVLEHSAHPTAFTMPYAWLVVIAALGAAAGVFAAALPARLAGRVDVLRALASE
jgi:putative ABC transport system permease protein